MTSPIGYRHKRAFIVGINKYARYPLNYCINDATDLKTALESIEFNVSFSENCDLNTLYHDIKTFTDGIQRDDLVLIYFAGHGKQSHQENYLLPSDYDYDHRGNERDYIIKHAVKVEYIMKKIEDKKCPVTIYLFDCCRNLVRTRATNMEEGLSAISATSYTLIVYACGPGKSVQDETRNNRNGSFMENLLKYITIPNKDIEEIMQNVAHDVNVQTNGFQLPFRTSSLTSKVFLVTNNDRNLDQPSTIIPTDYLSLTQTQYQSSTNAVVTSLNQRLTDTEMHPAQRPLRIVPPKGRLLSTPYEQKKPYYGNTTTSTTTNFDNASIFTERPKWPVSSTKDTDCNRPSPKCDFDIKLPDYNTKQNTPRRQTNVSMETNPIPKTDRSTYRYPENQTHMTESTTFATATKSSNRELTIKSIDVTSTKTAAINNDQPWQTTRSALTTNNSIYARYFQDDDEEGNASKESEPMTATHNTTTQTSGKPSFRKKTAKTTDYLEPDGQSSKTVPTVVDKLDNDERLPNSIPAYSSASATIDRAECNNNPNYTMVAPQKCGDLIVFVQSLKVRYECQIPANSTIKQLKSIIWQKININVERCQEESYILLLFTHRMHIFLSEETELVSEFMKLTPSEPHFYFYALKRYQQSNEMYTYETKTSDIFSADTNWWSPVHFIEDTQLPRPQSVLLSSLYALRLFFYKHNDELSMWRQVMEAQFFVHLRKFLFPPAVLALKHAVEGALFCFEKPLIVDSILQLLASLCPLKIKRNELCDCIPLFFCWLLEQCDPTATESDFYQLVNLLDSKSDEKRYFDDPATAVNANRVPLIMHEKEKIHVSTIRHVDIRSFTRYMQKKSNYANISYCKCDDYLIYDPPKGARVPIATISRLTDDQVKQLYETMARKYQAFTLITRGALRTDINDQLVLLQDRTVALMFTRKVNKRPKTGCPTRTSAVEHVFEIFNPLQHTVGKKQYVGADQLYQLNKNSTEDSYLSEHLLLNACEIPHIENVNDSVVKAPTQQITVVVLDISRSMFEKPASPDPNDLKTVLDMSVIMLGTMCDNIVFGRCAHDVGLIHFGTLIEVVCPITRNRNDFEKALSIQPKPQEWTSMYDALSRATTLIVTHEQNNQKNITPDCKKLIICISDGIDNYSRTTVDKLGERLKKYSIVVDFVSFLRDDLLTDDQMKKVCAFRQLCKETHGYAYQNLPLTNIELGATFEQEAALWLCERESKSFGLVDKPVRKMPTQLHYQATYKVPAQFTQKIVGASNSNRVLHEAKNTIKAQIDNINVYVCRNDIFFWKIILSGPSGTPYEGGCWLLYVHFGPEYPRQPPSIRFVTEIYHVNVNSDGRVCHHVFDRGWGNNTTMIEVFQSIVQLLREPNFDDAVSIEKAQLQKDQPKDYDRQVNECTKRHGSKSLQQLKKDFELEDW